MINKSKWQNIFVCLPKDIETQQAIVKKLDAINQQTQQLTQNTQNTQNQLKPTKITRDIRKIFA